MMKEKQSKLNRRNFLATAGGTMAALSSAPMILGAADKSGKKYRTALIGTGWWGMNILRVALEEGRTQVVALCDVDADALEISADEVDGLTGATPKMYKDYREMLEKEKLDVVIISSPDHWHALQGIAAVKRGGGTCVYRETNGTYGRRESGGTECI